MRLLQAGVDTSVIALWLGHESVQSTQVYRHADLALKEQALARTTPPGTAPGRYRPPDKLLAFLEALEYAEELTVHSILDQARHPPCPANSA
jgi:integrase/recombinase XerD